MLKFSKKLLSLMMVMVFFLGVSTLAANAENIIYYVKSGDTLFKLSTRFSVPINTIKQANNLKSDMLMVNQRLYIPDAPGFWNYTVRPGDTIYLLAQRFGVPASEIQLANNSWSAIYPGQIIVIPPGRTAPQNPAPPAAGGQVYTVRYGDSLFLISQRFGVSIADLRAANNIWDDNLMVGQQLVIPNGGTSTPQPPAGGSQVYTVKYGDSLYLISQRFGVSIAELRAANNIWDDNLMVGQQLVIPKAGSNPKPQPPTGPISLRDDEIDLLARLVTAEAVGEPYEGQVAVAATILNRLRSPNYPNTIRDIIYQVVDGRYYQFSPVLDGRINAPAAASAYKAVQDALSGWDPSNGAIGFYNPRKTTNKWVASQPVTVVIANHVFFRE
ncbi:MAG: LysM peptidoglycan-binding domain-containing protein [Firmicutes bacterium]|nr:LysM peptidoglycan-binding domain-containing protein [Bacillota bacterium]HQD39675.1 LysM peptidoglycan-binding domain-containing protein [Bacillota bacterium]